jgi:hypothetical protein
MSGTRLARIAAVAATAAILTACGAASDPTPRPTVTAAATPTLDASAQAACEHARNATKDATAGLLTDGEIRAKLQEVYANAKVSDNPAIRSYSEQALSAATRGDGVATVNALSSLLGACAK